MVNLDKVVEYDFSVILDASGSTAEKDVKAGFFTKITRWEAIKKSATRFAKDLETIGKGLNLVVMAGSRIKSYANVGAAEVVKALDENSPGGSTPMAQALTEGLNLLKDSKKKKFIIAFTDGAPDSRQAVKDLIVKQANSQATDDECTILFIQVGEDRSAADYLRMLDDDLKEAKFDIVDAKTAKEAEAFETTMALILHAIED